MGVYIIGCEELPWVKIGYTATVQERMHTLQTGCPYDLKLLCWEPDAGFSVERAMHEKFALFHHRREWFWLTPDMAVTLRQLASQCADKPVPTKRQKRASALARIMAEG